jgi:hypothetical protein
LAWIAVGAMSFYLIDSLEMRNEVPYGDLPSILSLRHWRILTGIMVTLVGAGLILSVILRLIPQLLIDAAHCVLLDIRLYFAERRLRKRFPNARITIERVP